MSSPPLGLLHPGQMGAALGEQLRRTGTPVYWCPTGRSARTAARADAAGLTPTADLDELLRRCSVVLAVCPPAAAEDLAQTVADHSFAGVYVDANAVSPPRSTRITSLLSAAGATALDGAVIGPPPIDDGTATSLYLAGPRPASDVVTALFERTSVRIVQLDTPAPSASALKMAYASFQKASRALAAVAYALADQHDVTEQLHDEALRRPGSPLADPDYLPSVAARAWRWVPELLDVADSLDDAALPPDLATAAARVLARWTSTKDSDVDLGEALELLRSSPDVASAHVAR